MSWREMDTELRPIGTVFTRERPASITSTDGRSSIATYEVVSHMKTAHFLGDKNGPVVEEIKPIKIEYEDGEVLQ